MPRIIADGPADVCQRKRNGNTLPGLATPKLLQTTSTRRFGIAQTAREFFIRSAKRPQMRGAFTTCWATPGSGAATGSTRSITRSLRGMRPKAPPTDPAGSSVEEAGTPTQDTFDTPRGLQATPARQTLLSDSAVC